MMSCMNMNVVKRLADRADMEMKWRQKRVAEFNCRGENYGQFWSILLWNLIVAQTTRRNDSFQVYVSFTQNLIH